MKCSNCGADLQEGQAVCNTCGQAVVTATTAYGQNQPQQTYVQPVSNQTYQDPNAQNQYAYGQPNVNGQNYAAVAEDTSVMSVGAWVITFIVFAIPIIGIIMMFVWAFGSTGNVNRRNFARASLILSLIVIVLSIVLGVLWSTFFITLLRELNYENGFGDIIENYVVNLLPFLR